jgi:trimeric autotransporter adhesin
MSMYSANFPSIIRHACAEVLSKARSIGFNAGLRALGASGLLLATALSAPTQAFSQSVQFLPNANIVAGAPMGSTFTTYTGEGGPATSATFPGQLIASTMDPYGNIYITDSTGNAIRRVDAVTGIITTYAGGLAAGAAVCPGTNGDKSGTVVLGNGCPATQAVLNAPAGIRFFKGNLYIADAGDNEIRVVNSVTGIITNFAGTGAKGLITATGKPATSTPVSGPTDIVFDPSGNAFIPTGAGFPYIVRVDASTGTVTIIAGTGTATSTGDAGPATSATVETIVGIALDPQGNVYFSCTTPENVRKVNMSTGIISTYVGTSQLSTAGFSGDGGPSNMAQVQNPQRISIDASGNLYIADQANHRIRMVTAPAVGQTYGIINTIVGTGTPSDSPSGTLAINDKLNNPRDVDITPAGDLLIADGFNRRIKVVAPPVNFAGIAVDSTASANASVRVNTALTVGSYAVPASSKDFTSAAPTGTLAGTATPCIAGTALAANTICTVALQFSPLVAGEQGAPLEFIDATNNIYTLPLQGLGNAPAAAVLPGIINPIAGTGIAGNAGDNAPAISALLNSPTGVAFDSQGNYFFTDSANNEVREISAAGIITTIAGTGATGSSGDGGAATSATLNNPTGIAVDGAGNIYIADTNNNRIRLVSNGVISTFAGTGAACNRATIPTCGDGGTSALAQLSAPTGLFLTPSGLLYIADIGDNSIRTVGVRSTAMSTLAGTGSAGYSGDSGASATAQFSAPSAVAVDANGNIYVADTGNNAIRIIHNGTINTYAGSKTAGFSDGPAATALFSAPSGLAVDAAGTLFVADKTNNAIRRIANGQVVTVAGTTTAGLTGNGGNSLLATFSAPQGVGLDNNGNLVVVDRANNVLRSISVASSQLAFPATSPGTIGSPLNVTLSNSGNLPLTVASITLPAGFSEQASGSVDCNTASLVLAADASCQANIVFTPTAPQSYSGTAAIADNAQNQTSVQSIALSGTGMYVYTAAIQAPAQVTAGQAFSITVSVTNPNSVYQGTVAFTTSDPNAKAVLPAQYTFTAADNGSHTFTGVQLLTAGSQAITVADSSDSSITATANITVIGGPPSMLSIISGNSQTAGIGTTYTLPLTVEALDSLGNPSAGASVTFAGPVTGADVTFTGSATTFTFAGTTNARGLLATPLLVADGVTGTFAVTAITAGAPAVSFNLTNTSTVPSGFTLTSSPSTINSLPPGTSATTVVTITPVGGFNAPVNVSCAVGAAPLTTCSVSTSTVAPSGNGSPTTFSVTIATTGPSANAARTGSHAPVYAALFLVSFGFALRNRKRLRNITLALFCLTVIGGISGCATDYHASQTSPGTYNLTVTGTSGSTTNTVVIPFFVAGAP